MESNIKSSFIPDKMPASQSAANYAQKSSGSSGGAGDIFILIAIVALAASLALAAGVFLYDRFLDANVQKKSEQLERARKAFEPQLIQELVRLDSRLQAADSVLANHLAPSELFNLLEELTLQSVSYDSLNYSLGEDSGITIKLKGKSHSVNGVALQASVFGQHNAISNPIFSDLDLVKDGVSFQVSANVNPSALRYTTVFQQYSDGVDSLDLFGDTSGDGLLNDEFADLENELMNLEGDFGDFGGSSDNGASDQGDVTQ